MKGTYIIKFKHMFQQYYENFNLDIGKAIMRNIV